MHLIVNRRGRLMCDNINLKPKLYWYNIFKLPILPNVVAKIQVLYFIIVNTETLHKFTALYFCVT